MRIGDPLTFSLVVTNAGPSAATNVVVVDTAPTGLTPGTSAASPGWTCTVAGQDVTLLDDPLARGATAPPLSLTYVVTSAAYPSAPTGPRSPATAPRTRRPTTPLDTVTVPPLVDLHVHKSHEGALLVGSEATTWSR